MIRIAIYGKGGIGKSTTVSNLAATFSNLGLKVMQIGCDPKSDSTILLMNGTRIPTVLDVLKSNEPITLEAVCHRGFGGVICIEAGGPTPGVGCAGRGIVSAFDQLNRLDAFNVYEPDIVLYDVLGDVVCGGFSMPLRGDYTDVVYVVTSGEMMSLYAANNIADAINRFKTRGYARMGGLILNHRNIANENELVTQAALEIGTTVIGEIPRSCDIHICEKLSKTVVEGNPESLVSQAYDTLARLILKQNGIKL